MHVFICIYTPYVIAPACVVLPGYMVNDNACMWLLISGAQYGNHEVAGLSCVRGKKNSVAFAMLDQPWSS